MTATLRVYATHPAVPIAAVLALALGAIVTVLVLVPGLLPAALAITYASGQILASTAPRPAVASRATTSGRRAAATAAPRHRTPRRPFEGWGRRGVPQTARRRLVADRRRAPSPARPGLRVGPPFRYRVGQPPIPTTTREQS